jgi:hypothetical protein
MGGSSRHFLLYFQFIVLILGMPSPLEFPGKLQVYWFVCVCVYVCVCVRACVCMCVVLKDPLWHACVCVLKGVRCRDVGRKGFLSGLWVHFCIRSYPHSLSKEPPKQSNGQGSGGQREHRRELRGKAKTDIQWDMSAMHSDVILLDLESGDCSDSIHNPLCFMYCNCAKGTC